jgi:hypothetical protein
MAVAIAGIKGMLEAKDMAHFVYNCKGKEIWILIERFSIQNHLTPQADAVVVVEDDAMNVV